MTERRINFELTLDTTRFVGAMRRAAAAGHKVGLAFMGPRDRRTHRVRCSICSPFANPKPLAIDGVAYRRRARNRRKR